MWCSLITGNSRPPGRPGKLPARVVLGFFLLAAPGIFAAARAQPPLPAASQAAQVLSLEAALDEAERRSGILPAYSATAASARALAISARQLPDPELQLSLDNLPVSGPARWSLAQEPMTMASVGLMQTFTRKNKRAAEAGLFEQESRLAETRRLMALSGLRRDTALAWLERYFLEQRVALLQQQRGEYALLAEVAEAAYRSGQSIQVDVFTARSELGLIDDRLREADSRLVNATTSLSRWVGASARLPLSAPPTISVTRLNGETLDQELAGQPELLLLGRQEDRALAEVELAEQNRQSDWSIEFMFSQRDADFGNMVSVGISRPLQLGRANKQDRELAAKLAQVDSVRHEQAEMLREYLSQAQRWLETWRGNLERLAAYDNTLVPLTLERSRAALAAYQGNSAPLSAALDARRMEIDTRLERLRIEMETAALWAQLEFLLPPGDALAASSTSANQQEQGND